MSEYEPQPPEPEKEPESEPEPESNYIDNFIYLVSTDFVMAGIIYNELLNLHRNNISKLYLIFEKILTNIYKKYINYVVVVNFSFDIFKITYELYSPASLEPKFIKVINIDVFKQNLLKYFNQVMKHYTLFDDDIR